MNPILRPLWELCTFKRAPQYLPGSPALLVLLALLNALTTFVIEAMMSTVTRGIGAALIETFFMGGVTLLLLQLSRHPERWVKTLTAIFAVGALIGTLAIPVFYWMTLVQANPLDAALPGMLLLTIAVWTLLVLAHIYRHALALPFAVAFLITVLVLMAEYHLSEALLPPDPARDPLAGTAPKA